MTEELNPEDESSAERVEQESEDDAVGGDSEERILPNLKESDHLPNVLAAFAHQYSGPLPSPLTLKEFEETLPGAAERIFAEWEAETRHRHETERKILQADVRAEARGQWLGFVLALIFLGAAVYLIEAGHGATGVAVVVGELVALVTVFILGRWRRSESGGGSEQQ